MQFFFGQVLPQHRQVVAEVEESLARIRLRQRPPSHMIDKALREAEDTFSHPVQPPAEVYLFIVGKEAAVQSARFPVVPGTYHHAGTCRPEDFLVVVILSVVILHRIADAPAAEGVAVAIEESARRTGILKGIPVCHGEQFRLAGGNVLMGIHLLNQRCQPVMRHLHVTVQQHIILALHLSERTVVPLGETIITV